MSGNASCADRGHVSSNAFGITNPGERYGRAEPGRRGYSALMDEGAPIAYEVLDEGVAVFSSDGQSIGTVEHVISAPAEDIFHGIIMRLGEEHRFVAADQIAAIHERGVDLRIDAAEAAQLPNPQGAPGEWRVQQPGVKPSPWKHLLDMLTGADPRQRNWTKEN
jgi:Uncharacterized protein conserved in bacteria (DUF2171)